MAGDIRKCSISMKGNNVSKCNGRCSLYFKTVVVKHAEQTDVKQKKIQHLLGQISGGGNNRNWNLLVLCKNGHLYGSEDRM
jgi:hypothetical protein